MGEKQEQNTTTIYDSKGNLIGSSVDFIEPITQLASEESNGEIVHLPFDLDAEWTATIKLSKKRAKKLELKLIREMAKARKNNANECG